MHNPTQYIVHNRGLECLRRALRVDPVTMDGELDNYWYVGSTGVGKSKAVRDKYPDLYLKMKNKWWDNYEDQETVLIEEWTKEYEMLGDMLLQWSDRYPVQVEYKGSSMVIRPKRIVVTSNFTIEECFIFGKVDVNAIIRRFKVIKM